MDAARRHRAGHLPLFDVPFLAGAASVREVAASGGLGRTAAGHCRAPVLPVCEDFAPRPQVPELAFQGPGHPGGLFPAAGPGRLSAGARPRPYAAGMRDALYDLPHRIGRRRHHRPPGRQPGLHRHLPGNDQRGRHLPHSAGNSAGESIGPYGVLGLCGTYCLEGVPRPHPARTAGLAHPLYHAPAPTQPDALGLQLFLYLGCGPYAGPGAGHPCAPAERPGNGSHCGDRGGFPAHLLRPVLRRTPPAPRKGGEHHRRTGPGPEEHRFPHLAGL